MATAVISATVRDVSREENIPVSVQYTLSTVKVVWNISVISQQNMCLLVHVPLFSLIIGHVRYEF